MSKEVSDRSKQEFWYQMEPLKILNEYCKKHNLYSDKRKTFYPTFKFFENLNPFPVYNVISNVNRIGNFRVNAKVKTANHAYYELAFGRSKRLAKREAASLILHSISKHDPDLEQIMLSHPNYQQLCSYKAGKKF